MIACEFDMPTLEDELCFPLYACSKELIRCYKPLLDPLELTYTQYLALMALWEQEPISVKALGDLLYLDSGTLSPVLKKLDNKGYVRKTRSSEDERSVFISLTEKGRELRRTAADIPQKIAAHMQLESGEYEQLQRLLGKLLAGLHN